MHDLSVARIDPVSARVHATRWEHHGGRRQQQRQPRQGSRERLLLAALPGCDPSRYDLVCESDAAGELQGVAVVEIATGLVVARISVDQIARLNEVSDQRGLFFERRG